MTYRELWHGLVPFYGEREAKAIADYVLGVRFGMSKADVLCGSVEGMGADDASELSRIYARLQQGEPVQYAIGKAEFGGREFCVRPGVLIPRPETEELCAWVVADNGCNAPLRVLDVGTGSGCIAITLKLDMPQCAVMGWDISAEALGVARDNAARLGADVAFSSHDILSETPQPEAWDIIVSNPPYICEKEKEDMERNVLDHEPPTALFVPDDRPLLFYDAIASFASYSLRPGGRLYVEINPLYADETACSMCRNGFCDVQVRSDAYGRRRMVRATKQK